jgi:hypothetical protein
MAYRGVWVSEFLGYVDENLAAAAIAEVFATSLPDVFVAWEQSESTTDDSATRYWASVLARRLFKAGR